MGLVDKWFAGKKKSEEPVQDRKVSRVPPSRYTDAELNQQVKNGWAMVYFWTPLSVPSIKQEPAIDALAAKLSGKVKLLKVNADENTSFAKRFAISAIPTTILLKDGRVIDCFIPIPKESDLLKQIGSIGTLEVLSEETPTKMSDIIAQVREKSGRVELHVEELRRKKDVDGLIGALKYREDGDIRADAAFALGDMKSDERVIKPLIEALGDNYFAVVAGAAKSLGQIHDAAAVEPLIRVLLNSGALTARSNAAVALGEINDTRAVESLIRALREDKTPEVREKAAWALRQVKDKRAIQPLIQAMRDDENWDVRGEATGALSDMGEAAVPFLIEALENDNDGIRGGAILALGHIGDKRAIVPLRQVLKYSKASIRDEASRVIKMIEQKTEGAEKGGREEWGVYENRERNVRYAHPSSWTMETYPTGGVGFSPPGEDINVALISGKSTYTRLEDCVKDLKATFDDYIKRKIMESAVDVSGFGLLGERNTTVGRMQACILSWRIFSQGTSRIHTELCVLAGANRFRLQCIAPDEVYERYKDTVDRIMRSFVVVE